MDYIQGIYCLRACLCVNGSGIIGFSQLFQSYSTACFLLLCFVFLVGWFDFSPFVESSETNVLWILRNPET